jgi:putative membrane protein
MRSFTTVAGLAFSLCVVACSHDDKPASSPPDPSPEMTPAARNAPSAPGVLGAESSEPLNDPQIVTVLRAVNVAEVDQARTAVGKIQAEPVKKFAEMMIAQHGQASKNIDALDDKLGYAQTDSQLGTELGVKATQTEQQLAKANETSIDKLYIVSQVDAHRLVLEVIDTRLVPAARNEDVKNLLQTTRPIVAGHLEMAQQILDTLK